MNVFHIRGGKPLRGFVRPAGNKNAVLPMIAAALLTDDDVVLDNVPVIGDVRTMLSLAESAGARVYWDQPARQVRINARDLKEHRLPASLCKEIRASILFASPLLVRLGRAEMAPPGGDVIGRRRLDSHFDGLQCLGAKIELGTTFKLTAPRRLKGQEIFLPETSVTATEQLLMAAVMADGRTTITNAASEPHVQDLCELLNMMGGRISGIGTNRLVVEGVDRLHGAACRVSPDHTEVGSFLAMAAATGGDVTVGDADPRHYAMTARTFEKLGFTLRFCEGNVTIPRPRKTETTAGWGGGIPVIDDGPWPLFPSDLMSVMIVLATQVHGTVLFFEKMYESRMYFVDRLIAMGANAVICDPHRVVVNGPSALHPIELSSPDIRAGMALVAAALCAEGTSTIRNVQLIGRGYEDLDEKLRALGADIVRA